MKRKMKAIVGEEVLQLPPFPQKADVEEFVSSIERKVEEFSQRNEHRLLLVFQTGRSQAEVASAAVEADINGNIASDGIFSVHADNVRWNRMPRFLISLLKIPHPQAPDLFSSIWKTKKE
ncbi:hypothetical protein GYA01_00730 [Patescibacteria group bacterium]|nr:hypothetical protein [Candidatus Paceibacterota bacterium]MDD4664756.1 hypothetical protein [Candidatus Paceibacterota bacterium]NMB47347.1 hypothetical protein [Patescibacteria group bacterium]